MVDILGADIPVPSFNFGGAKLTILLLILVVCIIIAVIMYVIFQWRTYNKKIIVFENISGQGYQPVFRDKARTVKLGDGGEELFYLKKRKVYRSAYGRKMGKNTYWFAIGQDGYWYNITLGDLDAKMGMLDVEPVDRDMRMLHVAIRKNISDRYKKMGFMDKYGTIALSGIFLLIMIIGIWFLLDKIGEISSTSAENLKTSAELQATNKDILVSMDNILSRSGTRIGGG